ncbi:hypothetical protein CVT25_012923 [Psilocybe cyanescens]|uniref:F-box domain-containing protein n=1 Tax=Psilocybe cyanescens TaxID=93625 RepID=A0A409VTT1_PSICY|nr:hypothetical protein CVT25_012923 [Psilocybe cyanescens]
MLINMDSDSPELIAELLHRSQSSPLFIHSNIPVRSDDSWTYYKWMVVLQGLHRFEVVNSVDDLYNNLFLEILKSSAPLLRSFDAKIAESPLTTRNLISERLFDGAAPNLRHINLTGYRLNSNVFHGLKLTTIRVNVELCPPSAEDWVEILSQQPALISLTIDRALDLDSDNTQSSRKVELPLLQELYILHCRPLDCGVLLSQLTVPSLCKLELSIISHDNTLREEDERCLHRSLKQFISNSSVISKCKLVKISAPKNSETLANTLSISAFSEEDISASQGRVFRLSYITSSEGYVGSNLVMFFEALNGIGILNPTTAIKLWPLPRTPMFLDPNLELLLKFRPDQLKSIQFSDPNQFIMLNYMRPPTYSKKLLLKCKNIYLSKCYSSVDPYAQHIDELIHILHHRRDQFGVATSTVTIDPGDPEDDTSRAASLRIWQRLDRAISDGFEFELHEKDYW